MSNSLIGSTHPNNLLPRQQPPKDIDSSQTPSDVLKDLQEISKLDSTSENHSHAKKFYKRAHAPEENEFESIPLTLPSQDEEHHTHTLPKQNISQNQSTNRDILAAFNKALAFGKIAFFGTIGVISTGLAIISPLTSIFGTALFVFARSKQSGSNLDDRDKIQNLPATIAQYTGAIIALPVTIAILSFNKAIDT